MSDLLRKTSDHLGQDRTSLFTPYTPRNLSETTYKLLVPLDILPLGMLRLSVQRRVSDESGELTMYSKTRSCRSAYRCEASLLISVDSYRSTRNGCRGDSQDRDTCRMCQMGQDMSLSKSDKGIKPIPMCQHVHCQSTSGHRFLTGM